LAYYAQLPRPPTAKEVADLLRRLLGDRKMVAVVDDIHLAGSELRRFLKEFTVGLMRGDGHRLYFISQEASFEELAAVPLHRLSVGGLDRAAAYELTDRAGGLSDRFEAVYQTTMGSPLLLNLAVLNPGITGPATDVPSEMLRQLPEHEIDAILPLAIANYPLPPSFLERAAGLTPERARELTRVGVLHPTVGGQIEMLQVVRNALLHQIRPNQEHQAHLRLALYFSHSRHPDSVRQRFIHLVEGEAWKPALQVLARQERLLLSLGFSDALRNAFRHLAVVLPRGPSRLRALTSEVKLLRQHSNYSEAIASLRRVIVEADHDPALTGLCHLAIADMLIRTRGVEEATVEFAQAREIGPVTRRLQAFLSFVAGRIAQAGGQTRDAESTFQKTFEFARRHRLRDLALESIAAWTSLSELHGGRHEETLRVIGEALPEARAEGRVDVVFNLLLVRSRAYAVMGLHDRAETELRTIRLEAESLGYVNQLAYALSGLAALTAQVGRDHDSATYARQAISLAERLGNDLVLGHTLGILCAAEFRMSDRTGDSQLARDAIVQGERSVEILGRQPPSDSLAIAHGHLAEVYNHIGDRPKALENFASAAALAERLDLDWMRKGLSDQLPDLMAAYDQLVSSKSVTVRAVTSP
jgi:tetratricopeptide (TPR) repeat protein